MKRSAEETIRKVIREILNGKYDVKIINQLGVVMEQLERKAYTDKEMQKYAPYFCEYSLRELKKLIKDLNEKLLEKLETEDLQYLETMRIIEALCTTGAMRKIKRNKNKVKFCIKLYDMAPSNPSFDGVGDFLELVAMLDRQ